jgi:tellurite resistance protein
MAWRGIDLVGGDADRFRETVRSVIERAGEVDSPLPTMETLQGAATAAHEANDDDSAWYFQSLLELSYIVASADGFADEERRTLAVLLEQVTGAATSADELTLHFKDLDSAIRMLGKGERLRRAAAQFETERARTEALSFVTVVAASDGELADVERDVLDELGSLLTLDEAAVAKIVDGVLGELERAMKGQG